jgi:AcrR family transcriptional regulator
MKKMKSNATTHPAKEKILAVAARLFSNRGYDATSMREVAEAARVTKPTIYYYFRSKEGLFEALLEHAVSSFAGTLARINARNADGGARKCLVDAVVAAFDFAREHADLHRFIHTLFFAPLKKREREAVEGAFVRVEAEFTRALSHAAGEGLVDGARLREAGIALRGAMMASIVPFLTGRAELRPSMAEGIVEGFLYGYAARTRNQKAAR